MYCGVISKLNVQGDFVSALKDGQQEGMQALQNMMHVIKSFDIGNYKLYCVTMK